MLPGELWDILMADKEIVTPLLKLLMDCSWEQLIIFLQRTKLRWNVSRNAGGYYMANIKGEGTFIYEKVSADSPKAAICAALAAFLITEKKDYHAY